jgi:hypothetical protein
MVGSAGVSGWPVFVGGDLVDGDELVSPDPDLGDVGADNRLLLAWGSVVEDVGKVAAELVDGLGAGRFGLLVE